MTRVDEAKAVVSKLNLSERGEFARWFHGWVDDEWDKQMAKDAHEGRLDELLKEVEEDIRQGRLRDLP